MNNGDGYILTLIGNILENDAFIASQLATVDGHKAIFVAKTSPTGNGYPCISLDVDFNISDSVIPSQNATVTIMTWLDGPPPTSFSTQGLAKLKPINDRINLLFNRLGKDSGSCQLTDVNVEENRGIRIVRMVKTFKNDFSYDDGNSKFFAICVFDVVLSEQENYTISFG